ncbi:MAG: potassium channel protein [Actinomycetia bacterium]|nr:potassium channel protein [Actinomycetes bacterium]
MKFKSRARSEKESTDPWRRFRAGVSVLGLVLVGGTSGYTVLGLNPLDAFYQTVITISTVGYREVGDVSGRYQVFTVLLILLGTGTALYTLSVLIETMFEGRLDGQFRRQRMRRKINRLNNHIVLCGYGQMGRAIEEELLKDGEMVVVVDLKEPDNPPDSSRHLLLVGDATDDHTLLQAGLNSARTLIIALDSDIDNLFIALTARAINSDLFIVARANKSAAIPKLLKVGADRVVNPHQIGGARVAALVSHPEVAEFLDVVMQDGEFEVRLAETSITDRSVFAHRPLSDCAIRTITGANVLAVRRDGEFITNPSRHFELLPGDLLICLGTAEQLEAVAAQALQR